MLLFRILQIKITKNPFVGMIIYIYTYENQLLSNNSTYYVYEYMHGYAYTVYVSYLDGLIEWNVWKDLDCLWASWATFFHNIELIETSSSLISNLNSQFHMMIGGWQRFKVRWIIKNHVSRQPVTKLSCTIETSKNIDIASIYCLLDTKWRAKMFPILIDPYNAIAYYLQSAGCTDECDLSKWDWRNLDLERRILSSFHTSN